MPLQHSQFARYAIEGISPEAIEAAAPLGFVPEDFAGAIGRVPSEGSGLWIIHLGSDGQSNLFRHRATGLLVPAKGQLARAAADDERAARLYLKQSFENEGLIGSEAFFANVRLMLSRASPTTRVIFVRSPPIAPWLDALQREDARIETIPAETPVLSVI